MPAERWLPAQAALEQRQDLVGQPAGQLAGGQDAEPSALAGNASLVLLG